MKTLELFCGTKSFSKVAESRGHETFTIDIDGRFYPNVEMDILDFDDYIQVNIYKIPTQPDIIWVSPPCQTFSIAGRSSNYTDFVPNNVKACFGLAYVLKAIEIIEKLKPKYWFIENPVGYLRKFPFMQKFHRKTVTYCQYGDKRMKPTDIWTNCVGWIPRKRCKNNDSCHERAPRGSKTGTQGLKDDIERGIIPPELIREILDACEGNNKIKQAELPSPPPK